MSERDTLNIKESIGGGIDPTTQLWLILSPMISVTIIGAIGSAMLYAFNYIYHFIRLRLICSITLQGSDDLYKMVLDFLT
jgi:hypothetical protein